MHGRIPLSACAEEQSEDPSRTKGVVSQRKRPASIYLDEEGPGLAFTFKNGRAEFLDPYWDLPPQLCPTLPERLR